MKSIPESQKESSSVLTYISPLLEFFIGQGNATDHIVRKLAHFAEFFALGCELMTLALVRGKLGWKPIALCLLFGLIVASIDETLQIFSNRGAQVKDVLLDFSGCSAGVLICILVVWLITVVKRVKAVKDQRNGQ